MKLFALLLVSFLSISAASAANEAEFRLGTFSGVWCSVPATYTISAQNSASTYSGQILIHGTGEVDKLVVEQRSDNSLTIRRYLSGRNQGRIQTMLTYGPDKVSGKLHFRSYNMSGVGCENSFGDLWL